MNDREIDLVQSAVKKVVRRFERTPNAFLTEDDLRACLWHLLIKDFGGIEETEDKDLSIPLHSEVRWYGADKKLKLRSDIVIVNVPTLKVLKYTRMPSKGYAFNIPRAIVELKLRRPNGESDNQFRSKIKTDIHKLKDLKKKVLRSGHPGTKLWVVALDKKKELSDIPQNEDGINVIYRFANVRPGTD